jgi:hypothetical protein
MGLTFSLGFFKTNLTPVDVLAIGRVFTKVGKKVEKGQY